MKTKPKQIGSPIPAAPSEYKEIFFIQNTSTRDLQLWWDYEHPQQHRSPPSASPQGRTCPRVGPTAPSHAGEVTCVRQKQHKEPVRTSSAKLAALSCVLTFLFAARKAVMNIDFAQWLPWRHISVVSPVVCLRRDLYGSRLLQQTANKQSSQTITFLSCTFE